MSLLLNLSALELQGMNGHSPSGLPVREQNSWIYQVNSKSCQVLKQQSSLRPSHCITTTVFGCCHVLVMECFASFMPHVTGYKASKKLNFCLISPQNISQKSWQCETSLCVLPSATNMETNKKSGRGQILFTAWTSRKKCVSCIWTSLLRHPVVYLLYSTHSILWYSEPSNNYSCCLCVKPKIWTVTTGSRPSSVLLLRFIKCSWVCFFCVQQW